MPPFRKCVRFVCASVLSVPSLFAVSALAQVSATTEQPLDPASPMAELPDIGVAWPEMKESVESQSGQAAQNVAASEAGERRYTITLEGLDRMRAAPVKDRFDQLSTLRQGEGKPANIAQIDRRIREDRTLLESILRTSGYYDAEVEATVDNSTQGPLLVRFAIVPGPLYRFQSVSVDGLESTGVKANDYAATFGVTPDDAVDADDVVGGKTALETSLRQTGYPFAKVSEPEVVIDHETRSGTLAMRVDSGGERNFGAVRITSANPPFNAKHVSRIARFRLGDRYDQTKIEDLRRALVATGVVGAVAITPVPGGAPGIADIEVGLEPAPLRTIAGEAGYGTGEGFRVEASWTHRNLFRPEGALTLRGVAGTREQLAGVTLQQSNFRRRDHVLTARLLASHVNQSAYEARTLQLGLGLERQSNIIWQKRWTWSIGGELLASDENDIAAGVLQRRQRFVIASLPLALGYDGSDNLLDPTKGFRLSARISPELSIRQGSLAYLRAQIDGSAYVPVSPHVVVAGRARFGSVVGAQAALLAPSRRFYAGGGGSVRGFGYQAIGPRDAFNDPMGGRSIAEFSLEARIRFGDFGVVPFVDAGNIYNDRLPKLSGFRYGAGVGVRYHSSFGPIRIDVGTPINPQKGDTPVTVFVSLGQAF